MAVSKWVEFPTSLPQDEIRYLIDVLTGTEKLDKARGLKAIYGVVGYLSGLFLNNVTTASTTVKSKRASKKQVAAALESLTAKDEVQTKAFPFWLIPILLDLGKKWLENKK
jgi:hypothetical protein